MRISASRAYLSDDAKAVANTSGVYDTDARSSGSWAQVRPSFGALRTFLPRLFMPFFARNLCKHAQISFRRGPCLCKSEERAACAAMHARMFKLDQ